MEHMINRLIMSSSVPTVQGTTVIDGMMNSLSFGAVVEVRFNRDLLCTLNACYAFNNKLPLLYFVELQLQLPAVIFLLNTHINLDSRYGV